MYNRVIRAFVPSLSTSCHSTILQHIRRITTTPLSLSAGIVQHRNTSVNNPSLKWDFTPENYTRVNEILAKFPKNYKQSAVMPLLTLAQEQNQNWLPISAMNKVAEICEMPPIRVYEVATFYSMYNREPLGKYHLQVCGTTPCMICGSEKIIETIEKHLHIKKGETTSDKLFTLTEVECLGACANAPMLQINNHEFYENLDEKTTIKLLDDLQAGKTPQVGPQSGLQKVAEGPQGKTSLKSEPLPVGVRDIDALIKQVKEDAEKAKAAAAAAANTNTNANANAAKPAPPK